MSDPTEIVTLVTYGLALGLLTIGTLMKRLRNPARSASTASSAIDYTRNSVSSADPESPYLVASEAQVVPPPLPQAPARVPTAFYHVFDLLGVGAVFLVFFALSIGSVRAAHQENLVISPMALVTSIAFQLVIAGILVAAVTCRVHIAEWLGLRWKNWPWVFLIAPAVVLGMWSLFGILQAAGYMKWMESLGVEPVQESVKLLQESNDPWVLGLMAFAAVIVAPLCEEIVFRGYLYPVAKKFAGPWVAVIFSALVFGCAHASLSALLPLTIFGIVLVMVYEKTGSLWSSIAVHFCFNGATVAIQALVRYYNIPLDGSM